jgi:hypothetical protein
MTDQSTNTDTNTDTSTNGTAGGYIDGNALAGPLAELFAVELTHAVTTCVGCGRRSRVAQLHAYATAVGSVARCPGCHDPVLRYVRTTTSAILDLRGTLSLVVPLPDPAASG